MPQTLTPTQLERLKTISSPVVRRRFGLYYQLPKDVQQMMLAEETAESVRQLVLEKHNLPEEVGFSTAKTIGLAMLGEIPMKDFISELAKATGLSAEKAAALAQDINEQIFQPVRESLLQVHGIAKDESGSMNKELREKTKKDISQKPDVISQREGVPLDELDNRNQEASGLSQNNQQKENRKNPQEAKKLTINGEEKEKKEALRKGQERARKEAEERRQKLIQRLKQTQGKEKEQAQKTTNESTQNIQDSNTDDQSGPQARTAAWDGNTIDLSKIPPRRKSPKKDSEDIQEA